MSQPKNEVKRNSKDTVFTCLFKDTENVLKLYQELHEEDTDGRLEDIEIVTLENTRFLMLRLIFTDIQKKPWKKRSGSAGIRSF